MIKAWCKIVVSDLFNISSLLFCSFTFQYKINHIFVTVCPREGGEEREEEEWMVFLVDR